MNALQQLRQEEFEKADAEREKKERALRREYNAMSMLDRAKYQLVIRQTNALRRVEYDRDISYINSRKGVDSPVMIDGNLWVPKLSDY